LKGRQLAENYNVYHELAENLTKITTPIGFSGQVLLKKWITYKKKFSIDTSDNFS
jgi:hypothetical protein